MKGKYNMKLWKWFIRCPILFLLLLGWLGLTAFTWSEGRIPQKLDQKYIENPVFTALLDSETAPDSLIPEDDRKFHGDETVIAAINKKDGIKSDTADPNQPDDRGTEDDTKSADAGRGENTDNKGTDNGTANQNKASGADADQKESDKSKDKEKDKQNTDHKEADNANRHLQSREETGETKFKEYEKRKTDSRYYSDPGKIALTTEFSYQKVDKSYFDDAVFIGDSRTVGMQDYSGLDNAQFFAKTGMNVYDILEDKFITDPKTGDEVSVAHMLKTYQYGKIYFMVGINELGTGNTGTFQEAYERVLRKFRKWQPDAVIYIQGIIPVSKAKASGDEIFNNININDKNVAIAQLADGKNIFYLDVSKKLTDKGGYLKADYTFDEVHMYAQHYGLWTDYLMSHAVVR